MRPFSYARPATLADALKLLSPTSRPKGGGNDLLDLAKRGVSTPEVLVDLRGVPWPPEPADGGLHVRADTTLAALAADAAVARRAPALCDAALAAATPQIRNTATVAGNLLQRPRCAYFRDPFFDCLKRGGTVCPAREGVHDDMAIFGNSKCCAVHPSNLATAIVALGAEVWAVERLGEDGKPVWGIRRTGESFFVAPETDPLRETVLEPGHLVAWINVPGWNASAYEEIDQKQSYDWPSVACAVALRSSGIGGTKVDEARVALGAVAPVPLLAEAAAAALVGKSVRDEAAWDVAAEAATAGATPLPRNGHKVRQLRAVVRRTIAAAAARWRS